MCAREKPGRSKAAAQVRVAGEADAAAIASITNAAFAIETFLEGMRTETRRVVEIMRQGVFLVGVQRDEQRRDERILASLYLEMHGARGYFGMLAVDPLYQGKGLGVLIVHAAEDYCRKRGCAAMDITVLSLRPELLPFYHRLGYVETGKEEFRPSRPMRPGAECYSILMSKNL